LSTADLTQVLSGASLRAVSEGVFLFRQGEPAIAMFLLESGRVRLREITADGRELLIRFVRPGEVFGDRAIIAGAEYRASAESDTPVRTYAWTTEIIVELLEKVPRLAINLFTIATQYLHYSRERYRLLATSSVDRRIRWALNELGRNFGSTHRNTTVITGRALQKDIANLADTTTYGVNRALRGYEQRGILTRKRGRIVLYRTFQ
jgi:CRP-like cAMP-binding protein